MKRFFVVSFRPFFVLTGIGTSLAGLYALWPRWVVETLGKLTFVQDYTAFVQHWGVMVGLMGVFMIVAAFNVKQRSFRFAFMHTITDQEVATDGDCYHPTHLRPISI